MKYFSDINKFVNRSDRKIEIQSLYRVMQILNTLHVKNWLDFGTLLGFYRDKSIIEYDNDIDICCYIDEKNKYSYSHEMLVYFQDEFYIKQYIEGKYITLVPKNVDFNLYGIDIFLYKYDECNKRYYNDLYPDLYTHSFFVDELESITLFDLKFNVPRHLDLFLKIRYGNDWTEKIKNHPAKKNNTDVKTSFACYTVMVADLFHIGHYNLLKRCKTLFDKVIVGVHNDEQVMSYKGKPVDSYEKRLENIKATNLCDVIYENAPTIIEQSLIDNLNVDFVVAGRENEEYIKKHYHVNKNKLHLIERTPNISTSLLKKQYNVS
jgi:cytidyltransferase-like protein